MEHLVRPDGRIEKAVMKATVLLTLVGSAVLGAHGAVPETARWQSEIDAAAERGGGRVVVPRGVHCVGQLELKSNVELHLEKGAVLEGSPDLRDYPAVVLPFSEGDWRAVVRGVGVTNVAITGEGEINGRGERFSMDFSAVPKGVCSEGHRPRGVFFADSARIRLADFTLRDAACWGVVFKCCRGVEARRVKIDSHAHWNNDGFDIEAADVLVEDCDVDAGDDAICIKSNNPEFTVENVVVRNCHVRSHCNGLKIGTASHGTIRNLRFENCRATAPKRDFRNREPGHEGRWAHAGTIRTVGPDCPVGAGISAVCVECVDGGVVENVVYDGIAVEGFLVPIFVRGGMRMKRTCGIPPGDRRVLRNVVIRNVRGAAVSAQPSTVSGVEGCRPDSVCLENVDIVCRGENKPMNWNFDRPGPEFAGRYPEATMFKDLRLPAFGLYVDQADGVILKNARFSLRKEDVDCRQPAAFARTATRSRSEPVPMNLPELLTCAGGSRVETCEQWKRVRRDEILKTFSTEVFGVRPVERPPKLSFEVVRKDPEALGGTAVLKVVRIRYGGTFGERDFAAVAFFPKTIRPAPTFVYVGLANDGLNTHRHPGDGQEWPKQLDERWPVQKILACGHATVAFRVTDVAPDDDYGFAIGAYACFETRESRRPESWGALSAWAWGASRVADWLETEPKADAKRLAVVGLSRCGKTAIWTAATDRRFGLCCSSGAGCCGDKLNHVELAPTSDEHVGRILRFRQWFCRRFDRYAGHDLDMPFDQHQLLALIAPRALCLAAASDDDGAGPYGQYLSAVHASPAWELYGKRGLVAPDGFPAVGSDLQAGSIAFHVRKGGHDLLAYDWMRFLDYARKLGWEER